MGSYFGNIQNAERTQLKFDKVYPNRKALEEGLAAGDGIFLGRFVLVEYDDNTNARRRGYLKDKYGFDPNRCELYVDSSLTIPYRLSESDPITGYGVFPNDLFYANADNLYNHYFVCLNETDPVTGNALFRQLRRANADEIVTDYELNYSIDKAQYKYMPDNGYDSTIWRKIVKNGKEIYQLIAHLNSELPSFYVTADAPSINPIAPHFDHNSTNKNYLLHIPSNWGLKIKEAENNSDQMVNYSYLEYNPITNTTELKEETYPGAIYYNKDGFSSIYNNQSNIPSEILLLPTGESGKTYYNHKYKPDNGELQYTVQKDIQELQLHLPEIGNSIAQMWNLIYGEGEKLNNGLIKRNQEINWNNTSGLRLVNTDPLSGGFSYSPEQVKTLAGCINSVHDLMGMIIEDVPENVDIEQLLLNALPNKIYYGKLGENNKKGYYFKDIGYELNSFENLGIKQDEWVGKKTYYPLIQFESNKYYTYSNGNFYIDGLSSPTPDIPYYELGEGKQVTLKEWQPLDANTGKIKYYYYKNLSYKLIKITEEEYDKYKYYIQDPNNSQNFILSSEPYNEGESYYIQNIEYIKDTNNEPDENKVYYTVIPTPVTNPNPAGGEILTLLWDPQDYTITEDIPEDLIDPEDFQALKITKIGSGYFYWDNEKKSLIVLNKDDEYNKNLNYYYIPKFAIAEGYDLGGDINETLYFITDNKKLISFSQAATNNNLLKDYYIKFLELKDEYYYYYFKTEEPPILEGYKCLHPTENEERKIDNTLTYYTITFESETSLEDNVYFYKPGYYFFKSENKDFTISNSLVFDKEATYWRITDKQEKLIEKDKDTNQWLINAIESKFYEAGKYYYFSKTYQKDLIDNDLIMKTMTHPDVVEEKTENGMIYYTINQAYVVNDPSGNLMPGFLWDKTPNPPEDVILGIRSQKYQWTELTGFARTLNTIHGLILNVNRLFKFNDSISRDTDTVQGGLNKMKDILNAFKNLNPGETVLVDPYGCLIGIDVGQLQLKKYDNTLSLDDLNISTDVKSPDTLNQALFKLEKRIKDLEDKIKTLEG